MKPFPDPTITSLPHSTFCPLKLATSVVRIPMTTKQNPLKRLPKFRTEDRVDHRIQRRVKIAQPQEEREHRVTDLAGLAQRHQQCGDEERQPADDKGACYNRQGFRRFSFALCLERLFALRHLRLGIVGRLRCGRDDRAVLHWSGHLTRGGGHWMVLQEMLLLLLIDQLNQVMWMLRRSRCGNYWTALAR